MKNLTVVAAVVSLLCGSSLTWAQSTKTAAPAAKSRPAAGAPRTAAPAANSTPRPSTLKLKAGGPLQGGVAVSVPRTPEEVGKYLLKMKVIVHDYEQVALATLLGNSGVRTDPESLAAARGQTLDLISRIRCLTPPAELKNRHYDLANTMESVGGYLQNPGSSGGGLAALTQVGPLLSRLRTSLDGYHGGVRNCMAYYGLNDAYDPFGGEDENAKSQLSGAIQGMESNMLNGGGGSSAGGFGGSSSGESSSGGLGGLGDIGQLLGGLGLGNVDAAGLQKMLGGMDTSQLGSLLNGLGGGGSGGLGGTGAGGLGRLNGLDLNSLGKLGGSEMNTLRGNDGNSGFGTGESGESGGMDLNALQNIFQQLQGGQ